MRVVVSIYCVLALAQIVLAAENCTNEVTIRKEDTCDSLAKFCQISLDDLIENNNVYFENGLRCNSTLAPDTKICCDVVTNSSTGTRGNDSDSSNVDDGAHPNKNCGGCPNKVSKVCGSDAKTYDSRCELEAALCWQPDLDLRSTLDGDCRKHIADLTCFSTSDCQGRFDPVCGSNGRTYCNRCFVNALQCSQGWAQEGGLEIKEMGTCPTDGPKRKCAKECPIVYEPVCGTDDLTYDNKCHLEVEACEAGDRDEDKKLEVLHDGPCLPGVYTSCHPLFQPPCIRHGPREPTPAELSNNCGVTRCSGAVNPVCGSDNRTFCNMCFFRNEACVDQDLKVEHEGVCKT